MTRIPSLVGIEEGTAPDHRRTRAAAVVGEIDPARESDENRLRASALEEGALKDRTIARNEFVESGGAVGKALGQSLAFADEGPDRRDLAFGVAPQDIPDRRLTSRPKRRHEGAGPVSGRIQEIAAEPFGTKSLVERTQIERLDSERTLFTPSVTGDAVGPADDAEELAPGLEILGMFDEGLGFRFRVDLRQPRSERFGMGRVIRHAGFHIGSHAAAIGPGENPFEPLGLEFVPDSG